MHVPSASSKRTLPVTKTGRYLNSRSRLISLPVPGCVWPSVQGSAHQCPKTWLLLTFIWTLTSVGPTTTPSTSKTRKFSWTSLLLRRRRRTWQHHNDDVLDATSSSLSRQRRRRRYVANIVVMMLSRTMSTLRWWRTQRHCRRRPCKVVVMVWRWCRRHHQCCRWFAS